MPSWLVEGEPVVYAALGCALVVLLAAWWRTRKRKYAAAAAVVTTLIVGYRLLDWAVESDGEQMVRKVAEITAAVSAHDLDAAFRNVSDNFDRPPRNKAKFRQFCDHVLQVGNVTEVRVWDLMPVDVSRPQRAGAVEFHFKVRGHWGESPPNYFGKVVFTLDPDGRWRVKTFDVYDSLNQSRTPIPIPGW
ncbi:MAG TPA: hypothetical protein VGF55_13290 [Gemmataceae bacterium]|jgi:hypothetical protein